MVQTIARFRIEFSAAKGYLLPGVLRVRKTGLYQHHQFPLGVLVGRVVAKFACPASCWKSRRLAPTSETRRAAFVRKVRLPECDEQPTILSPVYSRKNQTVTAPAERPRARSLKITDRLARACSSRSRRSAMRADFRSGCTGMIRPPRFRLRSCFRARSASVTMFQVIRAIRWRASRLWCSAGTSFGPGPDSGGSRVHAGRLQLACHSGSLLACWAPKTLRQKSEIHFSLWATVALSVHTALEGIRGIVSNFAVVLVREVL